MSFLSRQSKGFTLIEVMIALVVLAVGLLALGAMQIVSIRANAFSSEMTYATMLAQSRLEELKNVPFTDTKLQPTAAPFGSPSHPLAAEEGDPWYEAQDSQGYKYTIAHWVEDNTPATDMRTITLRINWMGAPAGSATEDTEVLFTTRFSTVIKR